MATRRQLGGISRKFSSIPVTRRRYADNEQKNRDAQFASENGQEAKPSGEPAYTSFSQERAETIPGGGVSFFWRYLAAFRIFLLGAVTILGAALRHQR